jgi:LacI family transcriptional regulator
MNNKSKLTLKQIANALNVSVGTVSKALNDSPEISLPTKLKIQNYAKLNKYRPNFFGLNLKTKTTKTIGLVIPNVMNSFFVKVFSGIEKVAEERGYNIITCISKESLEKEIQILTMLSNGTVDGFILSISEEAQKLNSFNHFNDVITDGTPMVMFDRVSELVDCDKVIVNDIESAINATQHLLDSGCKKIALFSSIDNLSVGKLRVKGYVEALKNNHIEINNHHIIVADNRADFDIKALTFFSTNKVDAIFAIDEYSSFTALKSSLAKGYSIPDELSIIGFADGIWSRRMTPSLTTMSQHGSEIGEVAARLLIDRIELINKDKPVQTIVIKTELKQRETTIKRGAMN